jgi:hypothetical protein
MEKNIKNIIYIILIILLNNKFIYFSDLFKVKQVRYILNADWSAIQVAKRLSYQSAGMSQVQLAGVDRQP